jgi:hypothetical protein
MKTWLNTATPEGEKLANLGTLKFDVKRHLMVFKVNKVVSSFMEFYNASKGKTPDIESRDKIVALLRNFAPGFSL